MQLTEPDGSFKLSLKAFATSLFLYPAVKLFRWYPALGAAIAASMVSDYLKQFLVARPIVSKFVSIMVYVSFVVASFYVAEVLVGLIAVAFMVESELIWTSIYDEFQKVRPVDEAEIDSTVDEDVKVTFRRLVKEVEGRFELDD